jgi:hypothetical protein
MCGNDKHSVTNSSTIHTTHIVKAYTIQAIDTIDTVSAVNTIGAVLTNDAGLARLAGFAVATRGKQNWHEDQKKKSQ